MHRSQQSNSDEIPLCLASKCTSMCTLVDIPIHDFSRLDIHDVVTFDVDLPLTTTNVAFVRVDKQHCAHSGRVTGLAFTLGCHLCSETHFVAYLSRLLTLRSCLRCIHDFAVIQSEYYMRVTIALDILWRIMPCEVVYRRYRIYLSCQCFCFSVFKSSISSAFKTC